ncbi:uncharacterized protein [Asterias amurensis]|uniref:uncharacterized protein isoform X2 n=1 Tax=Asterias amurensis TaxID=7602 RepID=UPI003AB6B4AB
MAAVNNGMRTSPASRKLNKKEVNVKFQSVTTGFTQQEKVARESSFDTTRSLFLHAPGIPVSVPDELIRIKMSNNGKSKKKKKSQKRSEKPESLDPYETDDKEARRLKELQECILAGKNNKDIYERLKPLMLRHMRVMDDLTKLRNHYYVEYMNKLTDKVEEQRQDIQKKTDQLNRRIQRKELQEKKEAHKVKKRHEKSSINQDNTFLENLPKSKLYQIICLEEKLLKEGKLRTLEDLENFWNDISNPDSFQLMFGGGETLTTLGYGTHLGTHEDIQSEPSVCNSLTSSMSSLHQHDQEERPMDSFTRGLSQIAEDNEPSRPGTKTGGSHSWAVTQQSKKTDKMIKRGSKDVTSLKEQENDPTVKLGKVEFPALSCFTLDLEPAKADPAVIRMREEYRQKARVREYEKRRVLKMYETSLTHQAATQRIIGKNSEFTNVLTGPSLADVTGMLSSSSDCNSHCKESDLSSERPPLALTMSGEPPSRTYQQHYDLQDDNDDSRSVGRSSRQSSTSSNVSQTRLRDGLAPSMPVGKYLRPERPSPLTLETILPECKIKEAKGLSTLWTNYGKFLPSVN